MFVGHLAVALAAKPLGPRVPLAALVAGSFGLDLLWPLLLMAGVEQVRVDPGNTAFTPLAFDSYPWSHSLAMVLVWGVLAGMLAYSAMQRARAAVLVSLAVISHWALDFLTHRPDLPVWPGGREFGLGLWNSIPGTLIVEGLMFLMAIEVYRRAYRPRRALGSWLFRILILVSLAIWVSG